MSGVTNHHPRLGRLRTQAPPLSVVVDGRVVAVCTTPEAEAAVRRLMGVGASEPAR